MPSVRTHYQHRLNKLLNQVSTQQYPGRPRERREARKLWRSVTNAFAKAHQRLTEYDLMLLREAVIWAIEVCRHIALIEGTEITYGTQTRAKNGKKWTQNGLKTDPQGEPNGPKTDSKRTQNAPPTVTKNLPEAFERYRKVMKELLARIRPKDKEETPSLAEILAPIMIEGQEAIEKAIEPGDPAEFFDYVDNEIRPHNPLRKLMPKK